MLTSQKIEIYEKYKGDEDMFAMVASKMEINTFDSRDWGAIRSLIQDVRLVNKNLCSESYSFEVSAKLKESCNDEMAIQLIKKISSESNW